MAENPSVIDDRCICFQDLFCFRVQILGNLMNLIFAVTAGAAHTNASALAFDLKFGGAFSAFHTFSSGVLPG
jgi:hypothetical protein